jgi:hypothetical protein
VLSIFTADYPGSIFVLADRATLNFKHKNAFWGNDHEVGFPEWSQSGLKESKGMKRRCARYCYLLEQLEYFSL